MTTGSPSDPRQGPGASTPRAPQTCGCGVVLVPPASRQVRAGPAAEGEPNAYPAPMERVLVHIRDPHGQIVSSHNATAWLGDPVYYDRFITGLQQRAVSGHTLDHTDADRAHQRLRDARAAHDVAYDKWLRGEAGLGPKTEYPLLDDYLPNEPAERPET